jgi:septum formation protein
MGLQTTGRVILASASPRRIELLQQLGLRFEIVASGVDEDFRGGESPREHVLRLAGAKAGAVSRLHPDAWVLGADTIVVIDGEILGKPGSPAEAVAMMRKLSGREHRVFTGFSVLSAERGAAVSEAVESAVIFRKLGDDEAAWYAATEEPYDKAGAYAVQGLGAFFIRKIRGSYTNVMGLPLCEVVDVMKRLQILSFSG